MATHNHQIREVQRNLIEIDGPANLCGHKRTRIIWVQNGTPSSQQAV